MNPTGPSPTVRMMVRDVRRWGARQREVRWMSLERFLRSSQFTGWSNKDQPSGQDDLVNGLTRDGRDGWSEQRLG